MCQESEPNEGEERTYCKVEEPFTLGQLAKVCLLKKGWILYSVPSYFGLRLRSWLLIWFDCLWPCLSRLRLSDDLFICVFVPISFNPLAFTECDRANNKWNMYTVFFWVVEFLQLIKNVFLFTLKDNFLQVITNSEFFLIGKVRKKSNYA